MSVQRLSHIGICVSDLDRSLRFYRDQLGFAEVTDQASYGGKPTDTLLELDGVELQVLHYITPGHTGDAAPRAMNALGLTHLSLRVAGLDSVIDALRASGAHVIEASRIDITDRGTSAIFVTDPDGTRIELVDAPGDPAALPAPPKQP